MVVPARHRTWVALVGAALVMLPASLFWEAVLPLRGGWIVCIGMPAVYSMVQVGFWLAWAWRKTAWFYFSLLAGVVGAVACYCGSMVVEESLTLYPALDVINLFAVLSVAVAAVLCPARWYGRLALFAGGILVLCVEEILIGLALLVTQGPPAPD